MHREYGLKQQNLSNFQNNTWKVIILSSFLVRWLPIPAGSMQHEGNIGKALIKGIQKGKLAKKKGQTIKT